MLSFPLSFVFSALFWSRNSNLVVSAESQNIINTGIQLRGLEDPATKSEAPTLIPRRDKFSTQSVEDNCFLGKICGNRDIGGGNAFEIHDRNFQLLSRASEEPQSKGGKEREGKQEEGSQESGDSTRGGKGLKKGQGGLQDPNMIHLSKEERNR